MISDLSWYVIVKGERQLKNGGSVSVTDNFSFWNIFVHIRLLLSNVILNVGSLSFCEFLSYSEGENFEISNFKVMHERIKWFLTNVLNTDFSLLLEIYNLILGNVCNVTCLTSVNDLCVLWTYCILKFRGERLWP
jgi:hypothetical protein